MEDRQGAELGPGAVPSPGPRIPIYDSLGLQAMELGSQALGVQETELMEAAGAMLWYECGRILEQVISPATHILVLVGPGNNGGDALVCARFAAASDYRVSAWLPPRLSPTAALMKSRLENRGVHFLRSREQYLAALQTCDLVLDGLFGLKQRLPLSGEYLRLVQDCSELRKKQRSRQQGPVYVAIDRPSGLATGAGESAGSPFFPADYTLLVAGYNADLLSPSCRPALGHIRCLPLCFPAQLEHKHRLGWVLSKTVLLTMLPRQSTFAFKKTRGFVALVTGSKTYPGARSLGIAAALATGAGGVYAQKPKFWPQAIPFTIAEGIPKKAGCVVIGSGWEAAPSPEHKALLKKLCKTATGTAVLVDGGGLGALAAMLQYGELDVPLSSDLVLSCHPGEFEKLWQALVAAGHVENKDASCLVRASLMAEKLGCTVLSRASFSLLVQPGRPVWMVDWQNAGLGFAGSGDIFAASLAALIARENLKSSQEERILSAYALQHTAASLAWKQYGYFNAGAYIAALGRVAGGRLGSEELNALVSEEGT